MGEENFSYFGDRNLRLTNQKRPTEIKSGRDERRERRKQNRKRIKN